MIDPQQYDLLLRSLDLPLSNEEQEQLEKALADSEALRREKEKLLRLRQELALLKTGPDAGFADTVMARFQQEKRQGFTATVVALFPKVAAACIALLLLTSLSIYLMEGTLTAEAVIGVHELIPEDAYSLLEE